MAAVKITRSGNCLTVTDGKRNRQAICSSTQSAKALETRLARDPSMVARWIKFVEPEQLELPLVGGTATPSRAAVAASRRSARPSALTVRSYRCRPLEGPITVAAPPRHETPRRPGFIWAQHLGSNRKESARSVGTAHYGEPPRFGVASASCSPDGPPKRRCHRAKDIGKAHGL